MGYGPNGEGFAEMGRVVGPETTRSQAGAPQAGKFFFESFGKPVTGQSDVPVCEALLPTQDTGEKESSLHQSALGPVASGPVHADGRCQNLVCELHFKRLGQDQQTRGRTVEVSVPVTAGNPGRDPSFYILDRRE